MRISCRAIIKKDGKVLLIHRKKLKDDNTIREYYVIPGGKQEENETDEETLIRELKEEVGIDIKPVQKVFEFNSDYDNSIQKFYSCEMVAGEINTGDGPEFSNLKVGELYVIEEITKENLKTINLVPQEIEEKIKEIIIECLGE